ncbi:MULTISPECIES: hypothetical protein [Aerosakkonema]|uniref:hypothetical protein n=1 Tax=Aerosakkonema TaxID=1246629 RepID=UPI0035BC58F6
MLVKTANKVIISPKITGDRTIGKCDRIVSSFLTYLKLTLLGLKTRGFLLHRVENEFTRSQASSPFAQRLRVLE